MSKEDLQRNQTTNLQEQLDEDTQDLKETSDSSTLPSRSEIHQHKRQKNKWKLKYPVIKLLALFFVLLPVVIYSWVTFIDKDKADKALKAGGESGSYETVGINKEKNTSLDVRDIDEVKESEKESTDEEQEDETGAPNSSEQNEQVDQGDATVRKDGQAVDQPKHVANQQTETKQNEENKTETTKPAENPNVVYHTVKPNETLFRIAMNYYQSQAGIDIIKNANGLASNEIRVGQVLKIPINK